jgi:hypothetical protein
MEELILKVVLPLSGTVVLVAQSWLLLKKAQLEASRKKIEEDAKARERNRELTLEAVRRVNVEAFRSNNLGDGAWTASQKKARAIELLKKKSPDVPDGVLQEAVENMLAQPGVEKELKKEISERS